MIKCSGFSVFPEYVEVMLVSHPAFAQAAVIGVPDSSRGESIKAFIVLKPDIFASVVNNKEAERVNVLPPAYGLLIMDTMKFFDGKF